MVGERSPERTVWMLTVEDLTYDNVVEKLIATVPEIRDTYEVNKEWMGSDYDFLPHLVFGDNLNPYLEALLMYDGDKLIVRRIFQFLEAMATSDDEGVQEILGATVLKRLSGKSTDHLAKARAFMSDATRQMSHEIAVGWGHELPYDDDPPEIKAMAPSPRPPRDER